MNDILHLKGRFEQMQSTSRPGAPTLATNVEVTVTDLEKLVADLQEMKTFWTSQKVLKHALVSVYYNKVAAKSNRISGFLSNGSKHPNTTVVGAKFSADKKHIITHYIPLETITNTIDQANKTIHVLNNEFSGTVDAEIFNNKNIINAIDFEQYGIVKTTFQKMVKDASYVSSFGIEQNELNTDRSQIVTLYQTEKDIVHLLAELGMKNLYTRIFDETTVFLYEEELQILKSKAPFLVAMAVEDLSQLSPNEFGTPIHENEVTIPSPSDEPVIGVIDTLFDEDVYFSEWVEFHNEVNSEIPIEREDYLHGTAVSSIVVDGPSLNPELDDGCGRFRVRHFGVATRKSFSTMSIIRSIKNIIANNKDIRVWNLSLGSNEEINRNFISAEAATLDKIQYENDVIFVIAGTNKAPTAPEKRIGSPADSINSIVVNAVTFNNQPTAYTRNGTVLSFFTKPDVSYYGGDRENYMWVCEPLGKAPVTGTSYAAPWISRKLSYLIDVLGFNREIAKAMIIDAAIGWGTSSLEEKALKGHGVVPIRVEDIVKSPNDEIKFIVSGVSEKFDTYNYNFPVPIHNGKHPYVVKATICYFPKCSRNQGVDYTNTELDLYFGRIDNKFKIKSINNNKQSAEDDSYTYEEQARKLFGKWDNVKHISEELKTNPRARKAYDNKLWGMSIKTKERLTVGDGEGIRFGVVVTLKEINGVNRIEDFIQQCSLRGWIVNRIDVENRVDIYTVANEEIVFE